MGEKVTMERLVNLEMQAPWGRVETKVPKAYRVLQET